MVMSPVHQVCPKWSCKAQWKGEEDKANRGRGGTTTSGNGQAWSSASPRGQWRTGKNGEYWLQNHLWCPNNPCGQGIDDDDDETLIYLWYQYTEVWQIYSVKLYDFKLKFIQWWASKKKSTTSFKITCFCIICYTQCSPWTYNSLILFYCHGQGSIVFFLGAHWC